MSAFDTEMEAKHYLGYIKTKFVRALIAMITATQHLSRTNFRYVPLQDFSRAWTDDDLYTKYKLSQEEVSFIERTIKPMD